MKHYLILPLLVLSFYLAACTKDETIVDPPPVSKANGVYVVNEGNFQRGNSSLTWFDAETSQAHNSVFLVANGRDLGDVGNDIVIHENRAYVIVNNSDKVEVVSIPGHASVTTWYLKEGSSPRHIVFDDNGIAYISCLLRNSVQVVDPMSGSLGPEITVGANPEGVVIAMGKLFVANSGFGGSNTVSVVDLETYTLSATITVGDYPSAMGLTKDGMVAVLCTGAYNDYSDPNDDTPGMLYLVDPSSTAVTGSVTLGGHPQRLSIDAQRGVAYTVDNDIVRIDLANLTTVRLINGFYYGVLVDADAQRLYVTDPLDYQQPGKLLVYDLQGEKLSEHTAGVIPGAMAVVKRN